MAENSIPYIIQINEVPIYTINLDQEANSTVQINSTSEKLPSIDLINNSFSDPILQEMPQSHARKFSMPSQEEQPCIVQVVYPQDLSLSPMQNIMKRGRPKKKKQDDIRLADNKPTNETTSCSMEPPKTARTRSGRLVKLPKYIEKDFKKIEISAEAQEIQVTDFKRFEGDSSKLEFTELHTKKRTIASQYRCPKCLKAYLGKNKMVQHLKKYPDHGPLPEGYQEFNFDVWNYLFDITQKCKSGQKGVKFCEELSNLLHNVQLLKNALFKTASDNKNCVQIDKVLGNAIGLPPGKYRFDENELYKDVTVLQLITNSDFFKPSVVNTKTVPDVSGKGNGDLQSDRCDQKKIKQDIESPRVPYEMNVDSINDKTETITNEEKDFSVNATPIYDFPMKNTGEVENNLEKSNHSIEKKLDEDNPLLSSELLTDNLLLQSLPNPRNPEDELMLTAVDNSSNLLDNSTSSDEVMNVDQFVNERFKKITEPDIELTNTSLNLDLPGLELFQFHTS